MVGRLHPQKGIDVALQAARILQMQGLGDKIEVAMYGAGYTEYDYHKMAFDLGVADVVHFHAFEKDIFPIYQSADCFLLPSRGEGLSNSLLEAMAMELPVIATAVSGTLDVIEDRVDGILVPADSPEMLAEAMKEIVNNPRLAQAMGKKARQKVECAYSLDSIAQQYSDLYENLR